MGYASQTSPNVNNLTIGKGVLYFDRYDANGNLTGERHLGNAPSFTITPTVDTLPHYSSMSGIKSKDLEVNITNGVTIKFTLEEFSLDNIAMIFSANEPSSLSQGDGNVGAGAMTAKLNKYVKIVDDSGNHVRNISRGSVTVSGGYVENTDYVIDYEVGRFKALSTGSISADESLTIACTFGACTWQSVSPFSTDNVEGFLRFVSDNDVGIDIEVEIWKVKLQSNTDLNMISEEWASIEFTGEVLKDATNHPTNPWMLIRDKKVDISES